MQLTYPIPFIKFLVVVLTNLSISQALLGQSAQSTLIGHQDFISYYNPSVLHSGNYASLAILHRNQWQGTGPNKNMLSFHRPFLQSRKSLRPLAYGIILLHDDLGPIQINSAQAMFSGQIKSYKDHSLNIGVNICANFSGINVDKLDLIELTDTEAMEMENQFFTTNRIGLTYRMANYEFGASSGFYNFTTYTDLHFFTKTSLSLRNPKYVLEPIVVCRINEQFSAQLEGQLRVTFNNLIGLTMGYRQNFGMIFQLSFNVSKIRAKASYGIETPQKQNNSLGMTQETFIKIDWETKAFKKQKLNKIKRAKTDSIRFARRDSVRAARLAMQVKNDSMQVAQNIPDTLVVEEEPIAFEELPLFQKHIEDNTHVIMKHIHFEKGQDIISPDSFEQLEQLAKYLKHHHHFRIEIQGHSDNVGDIEVNMDLSKRRALAVTNYVLSRGVATDRIEIKGYGPTRPIAPNDNEKNRKLNRRVEIVFHVIDKK